MFLVVDAKGRAYDAGGYAKSEIHVALEINIPHSTSTTSTC